MNTYNQNTLHQHFCTAYCIVFSRDGVVGYTHNWREANKICKRYPDDLQWDYVSDLNELHQTSLIKNNTFTYIKNNTYIDTQ